MGPAIDILGNRIDRKASAQDAEGRQWISDARGPCSLAPWVYLGSRTLSQPQHELLNMFENLMIGFKRAETSLFPPKRSERLMPPRWLREAFSQSELPR